MKKSKCCQSIAIKQEAGNYFCDHCISICETKTNFNYSILLIFLLIFININCYAPNITNKILYKIKQNKTLVSDYYTVNPLTVEIIESNGNTMAISIKDAKGIMQITSICLKDYNQLNNKNYTKDDLFNPYINKKIATWYIQKRIPQLLKSNKLKVNVQNILITYNGGIEEAIRFNKTGNLNKETQNYLNKYFKNI